MYGCQEQLAYKIIQMLTKEFPQLEVDMVKQLDIKNKIANELYEYEVTSKCTSLVKSDVKEWICYYLSCKKLQNLSDSTLYNYKLLLDKFEQCVVKPIRMINTMDIRNFLFELKKTSNDESINNKLITLNSFFNFVKEEGGIEKNPCARVEKPKYEKHESTPLTQREQEIMRDSCKSLREKAFFELMISSGIRIGELCNIRMGDINLENRTLFVRKAKGNKTRTVRFSTRAKLDIENYMKMKHNHEYLFESSRKPYGNVTTRAMQDEMGRIVKRSGLETRIFCHKLRTTNASNAIQVGVPITSIQKMLGHSHIDVTIKSYARLSDKTVFNDYEKVYQ